MHRRKWQDVCSEPYLHNTGDQATTLGWCQRNGQKQETTLPQSKAPQSNSGAYYSSCQLGKSGHMYWPNNSTQTKSTSQRHVQSSHSYCCKERNKSQQPKRSAQACVANDITMSCWQEPAAETTRSVTSCAAGNGGSREARVSEWLYQWLNWSLVPQGKHSMHTCKRPLMEPRRNSSFATPKKQHPNKRRALLHPDNMQAATRHEGRGGCGFRKEQLHQ